MSAVKQAWTAWDSVWDPSLTDAQRLERLKECATPDFVYTNPEAKFTGDLEAVAKYIAPALEKGEGKVEVRHVKWLENNDRCAMQWEVVEKETGNVMLPGVSYGRCEGGRLKEAASFY